MFDQYFFKMLVAENYGHLGTLPFKYYHLGTILLSTWSFRYFWFVIIKST